jgi:biotin transport system substrate-specific component
MSPAAATAQPRVLADVLPNIRARDVALVVAGALLTALCAQIAIYLPGDPVPLTGQTFAVLLCGAGLGAYRGASAMLLYLGLGLIGVPVYADGESGVSVVWGATGGYLIGFIFCAYIVGKLAERRADRTPWKALPAFALGSVVVYAIGVPWLAVAADISLLRAFELGVVPFIPGAIVKAVGAAALLPTAWKLIGSKR